MSRKTILPYFLLLAGLASAAQVLPKPQIESAQGQPAPDFVLKDQHGKRFRLSAQRGKRVLLMFFRGHWWVYCAAQLRDFAQHSKDFEALNTRVVAISVDDREHARQVWEKAVNRQFTVLSDPGAQVIRTYGILHPAAGDMGQDIARDTTLLVDVDGRERWRSVSQTITDHPKAEEVLARIRRLPPSTKPAAQDTR